MALTPEHAARVLDLDMTASVADVQSARRKLAKQYHPDTNKVRNERQEVGLSRNFF